MGRSISICVTVHHCFHSALSSSILPLQLSPYTRQDDRQRTQEEESPRRRCRCRWSVDFTFPTLLRTAVAQLYLETLSYRPAQRPFIAPYADLHASSLYVPSSEQACRAPMASPIIPIASMSRSLKHRTIAVVKLSVFPSMKRSMVLLG